MVITYQSRTGIPGQGQQQQVPLLYSRRRRPGYPVQTRYNLPIEILWTIVPLVMVAVLTNFYFWVYRRAEARLA